MVLYSIRKDVPSYLSPYGLNPSTWAILRPQFLQAMRDLRLGLSEPEIEQLAGSLDPQFDGSVLIHELNKEVEKRKDEAIEKFARYVGTTVLSCMAARRVTDLMAIMRRHDWNNSKEVPAGKFEQEIRQIVGDALSQTQLAFVFTRYEARAGMVNYERFASDVMMAGKAAAAPVSMLVDRPAGADQDQTTSPGEETKRTGQV